MLLVALVSKINRKTSLHVGICSLDQHVFCRSILIVIDITIRVWDSCRKTFSPQKSTEISKGEKANHYYLEY